MLLAVFKKVDCSKKVMLNHLPAARAAINARKYAWVGRSIDYPIGGGKSIKVARVADVEMAQLNAHLRQDGAVQLAARATQIVNTDDLDTVACGKQVRGDRTAGKSACARQNDLHALHILKSP